MTQQRKYFTDDWTPEQWRTYKAHGLAKELYSLEKHQRRDWWNLPTDAGMSVNVHVTLMPDDKVIEYVTSAGYTWDGQEWTAAAPTVTDDEPTDDEDASSFPMPKPLSQPVKPVRTTDEPLIVTYLKHGGKQYRFKVFTATLWVERQPDGSNLPFDRATVAAAGEVFDGVAWEHASMLEMIHLYEVQMMDEG